MAMSKTALAALRTASRLKPSVKGSLRLQRTLEDVGAHLSLPNPHCRIDDMGATMPDGYEVPLRVFTPLDISLAPRRGRVVTGGSRGTILFFHGGGWVTGDIDTYTDACSAMAIRLERRVVSVGYRLAPEWRFPRAAEDCFEVARQLFSGELVDDVDPGRVVLFGDSAGGNLAAVTSLMARDRGAFEPPAQVLLYPVTYSDHDPATSPFDSVRDNGRDYLLTSADMCAYVELYASRELDRADPYLAPLLMRDLTHQPRTLVVTAEYDPLRDEGEAYAVALADAGAETYCFRMLDAVHGYLLYPAVTGIVRNTYRLVQAFLDRTEIEAGDEAAWVERGMR